MSALRDDLKRLTLRVSRLNSKLEKLMAIADDFNTELAKHQTLIQQIVALVQQLAANQNGTVPDSTVQAGISALQAMDASMSAVLAASTPAPAPAPAPTNGAAASATPTT